MTAANLRGRHDLGAIVGYTYRIYAANFVPLFLIALLTAPFQLLIGVIDARLDGDGAQAVTSLLQLPAAVVGLIATAAIIHAVGQLADGNRMSAATSIDAAIERFPALIGATLIVTYRVLLSFFAVPFLALYWLRNREATIDGRRDWWFAVVPLLLTFYLVVRWAFLSQVVMLAGKRGWAALDESADLVRGRWWRVFGIMLVIGLIAIGPILIATVATLLPPLPSAAITSAVFALVFPFYPIAQTLLYFDLASRRAAPDAEPIAASPDTESEGG